MNKSEWARERERKSEERWTKRGKRRKTTSISSQAGGCDSKMASSLTADSFYSLSTQHQFSHNKELIYVKLTDAALRAIEDYARNQVGSAARCGPSSPSNIDKLSHFEALIRLRNRIKSKIIFSFRSIRDVKEKKWTQMAYVASEQHQVGIENLSTGAPDWLCGVFVSVHALIAVVRYSVRLWWCNQWPKRVNFEEGKVIFKFLGG